MNSSREGKSGFCREWPKGPFQGRTTVVQFLFRGGQQWCRGGQQWAISLYQLRKKTKHFSAMKLLAKYQFWKSKGEKPLASLATSMLTTLSTRPLSSDDIQSRNKICFLFLNCSVLRPSSFHEGSGLNRSTGLDTRKLDRKEEATQNYKGCTGGWLIVRLPQKKPCAISAFTVLLHVCYI